MKNECIARTPERAEKLFISSTFLFIDISSLIISSTFFSGIMMNYSLSKQKRQEQGTEGEEKKTG